MIALFFLWKKIENSEKLLIKMAKMRQNRHQCIFGVISFHAGVYFGKINTKFNNCNIVYYYTAKNLDKTITENERNI